MRSMHHLADRILDRLLNRDNASAGIESPCKAGGSCWACVDGTQRCYFDQKCRRTACLPVICR